MSYVSNGSDPGTEMDSIECHAAQEVYIFRFISIHYEMIGGSCTVLKYIFEIDVCQQSSFFRYVHMNIKINA